MKYYRKVQVDAVQFNQDSKQEVEDFLRLHKIDYKFVGTMLALYPSRFGLQDQYWYVCDTNYIVLAGSYFNVLTCEQFNALYTKSEL